MANVRIDKIGLSTLFGSFINYDTPTSNLVVAATPLGNGSSRTISVTIPYTRGGTVADIYATRGGTKTLVNTGGRAAASAVYSYSGFETATFDVIYNASNIVVSLIITNNSGGTITPNAQTISISVVQYDAPITSV